MPDIITLNITIDGDFPNNAMVDWIVRRATLLDLSGGVICADTTCIKLTTSGERVLADAFEVACSLGHIDAQVDSITRSEIPTDEAFYRQATQFIRYWPPSPSKPPDTP